LGELTSAAAFFLLTDAGSLGYKDIMDSDDRRLNQAFLFSQAFMRLCALRQVPVGDRETRANAKIWKELKKIMAGKQAMSAAEQEHIGKLVADWRALSQPETRH
jgi:hypothetical protein